MWHRSLFVALVSAGLTAPMLAAAHDSWIARGGYRSPATGEWCCGTFDCVEIPQSEVKLEPGGYTLITGETVPHKETLVSEDGKYWRCHRPSGARRCFFAPAQGS